MGLEPTTSTLRILIVLFNVSVIQTAMVPIGFPGPFHSKALHLDMYTSTAMLSAIVGIVNIVLLIVVFKEHVVNDDDYKPHNIQSKHTGNYHVFLVLLFHVHLKKVSLLFLWCSVETVLSCVVSRHF